METVDLSPILVWWLCHDRLSLTLCTCVTDYMVMWPGVGMPTHPTPPLCLSTLPGAGKITQYQTGYEHCLPPPDWWADWTCQSRGRNLPMLLSTTKFAINQRTHSTQKASPFYLMMGYEPKAILTPFLSTLHSSTYSGFWLEFLEFQDIPFTYIFLHNT